MDNESWESKAAKRANARFEPTLIERALSQVAPKAAQRLLHNRLKFEATAMMGRGWGGYVGARRDRAATADWNPGGGSPAVDILPDLPALRDRSRDQMRNAPVALGALNTDVLHVVGSGLSYTPAINAKRLGISDAQAEAWGDDTAWRFGIWAASKDCDYTRQLDFYDMADLTYRSWKESGDVFVLTPIVQRNNEDTLALQVVEADRVCNPRGQQNSDTLQDGVVLVDGVPVAVQVAKNHPGDYRGVNEWTPVTIRGEKTDRLNVIHLFDILRPGNVRGAPWIAPIIEPLKQLQKWSDAELNAAVVTSIFAVFMQMDPDAFEQLYDDDSAKQIIRDAQSWSGKMDSGKAINLLPGETANMVTPTRPNPDFDPFWNAMVAQLGMALGIPKEVLTMHFQSSYSAARAALIVAWRGFMKRRGQMAKGFCQPIFELWLANEVSVGRIACPGFFADRIIRAAWCGATWTGDGPGALNPLDEVTAAEKRVNMEMSTLQDESIAYDGRDWNQKHRQRAKEVAAQKRDGTYVTPAGSAPTATPANASGDGGNTNQTDGTQPAGRPAGRRQN